jgi:hypothetical protein
MKHWIEHGADGAILLTGLSPELPAPGRGGLVIEVPQPVDPTRSVFLGDTVFDVGPRPSMQHVLDFATCEWVLWTPPNSTALQVAQEAKWEEIKAARERLEKAGFEYLGRMVDSDAESALRITGATSAAQAALAIGAPFSIAWTCQDNSVLELDAAQMVGMLVALAHHADQVHQVSRGLRAQIFAEDATEVSLAAVAWPEEEVTP